LIEKNKGNCNCYFNVTSREFEAQQVFISRKYSVKPTDQFLESVRSILGKNSIKVSA
jgi:hypothetical protein